MDINLFSNHKDIYGCFHYQRFASILAPCCNKFYPCRWCHDNNENHEINRFDIKKMKCLLCNKEQNISSYCINCNNNMAKYFCSTCNILDNYGIRKQIFHCNKCGICRIGGKENFHHCDKCNGCIHISLKDKHKCIQNTMKQDCSICLDDMFNSRNGVIILKCGHSFHKKCINNSIMCRNYFCPLCRQKIEYS